MSHPQDRVLPSSTDVPAAEGQTLQTQHGGTPAPELVAETRIACPSEVVAVAEAAVQTIAGYEIEGELGRGGMGVVYKARQKGLGRLVALKMILHADHASAEERERFHREAKALAGLRHESIVQIYEVGEHDGKPFFSLEYIEGGSLDRRLRDGPLPAREAAALVEVLAGAMQAAHAGGIIHRDLKPANVLLSFSREPLASASADTLARGSRLNECVPKITDFGLAKKQDEGGLSASGAVIGTPSYMAPEQAAGKVHAIDERTDVYALGAILYECLTGRPPFRAATVMDTMLQVMQDEPVSVCSLQPATPQDLETVCLKCLQKDPAKRYASAQGLADDLGRFLRGEPVVARPVGRIERGWRWCRRNPSVASLLSLVLLLLLLGTSVGWLLAVQARASERRALDQKDRADREAKEALRQKGEAEKAQKRAEGETRRANHEAGVALFQKGEAEKARKRAEAGERAAKFEKQIAEFVAYAFRLREAQSELKAGRPAEAQAALQECDPKLCRWEHDYLLRQTRKLRLDLRAHLSDVYIVAFSPDGKRIVSGSRDKTVKVWDAHTGQQQLSLKGDTGVVRSVAFSPDGKRIVSGSLDSTVKVWDAHTGQEALSLKGHTGWVNSVAFSPDGTRIVSASGTNFSGEVKVWDAQTGQQQLSLKGHTSSVWSVCFSPDGKRIVSGSGDQTVKVWDALTGKEALSLEGHTSVISSVAFSPDSKRIASASAGGYDRKTRRSYGEVKVWDARTGQEQLSFKGHTNPVSSVAFSPDGKRIASGSADKTVKVWDAHTGQEALSLKGHTNWVNSVAFSPNGKRIASASVDGTVKVWDAQTGQEILTLKGHTSTVSSVAFSPEGKRIASASGDGTVKVWDAQTGQQALTLKGHTGGVSSVAFSPDGKRIASGGGGYDPKTRKPWGEVKVWDAHTGQEVLSLKRHTSSVRSVAFSPDGQRLASGSQRSLSITEPGEVRVWDAQTGQEAFSLKGHTSHVNCVAFSPDGKRLASGSQDKTVKVWDSDPAGIRDAEALVLPKK